MNVREFRPTRQGKAVLKKYGYTKKGGRYGMALLTLVLLLLLPLYFMVSAWLIRSFPLRMGIGVVIFVILIVVVVVGSYRNRGLSINDYVIRLDDTTIFIPDIPKIQVAKLVSLKEIKDLEAQDSYFVLHLQIGTPVKIIRGLIGERELHQFLKQRIGLPCDY